MPYSVQAKNAMLDALGALVGKVSLHSANPGSTGASELTGGSYARQAVTWSAASAGSKAASNQPAFSVPAGATVAFVGYWSTDGATYHGYSAVTSETFAGAGTYTITSDTLDLNATASA